MKCEHHNFECNAIVNRMRETDDGPINRYNAEIKIFCVDCGIPFEFVGLPLGLSPYRPTISMDGLELRAPITPLGVAVPEGLPSMAVLMTEGEQ